jgi:hypothetical protein
MTIKEFMSIAVPLCIVAAEYHAYKALTLSGKILLILTAIHCVCLGAKKYLGN